VTGGLATVGRELLFRDEYGPDVPTSGNLPGPVDWPTEVGNSAIRLRYRPTWLPDGFVEFERATTVEAGPGELRQRRTWYPEGTSPAVPADTPRIVLELAPPLAQWQIAAWRTPVRVNGARGGLGTSDSVPVLLWEAGDGLNLGLSVSGFSDNRGMALAIARSVVPDNLSTVEVSLSFGWRPEIPYSVVEYETGPGGSSLAVVAAYPAMVADQSAYLRITLDRQETDTIYETEPVTLRGARGRWYRNTTGVIVWLTLPDGRLLQARALRAVHPDLYLTDDDVLRAIEELQIGPRPANHWISTR
jgi:hypothetical protein